MKKALLFAGTCMLLINPAVYSEEYVSPETEVVSSSVVKGDYSPQLIEKIKIERNSIYNALNLTPKQIQKKDAIEIKRYRDLEPVLRKLCLCRKQLKEQQSSKDLNNKSIDVTQKELNSIKQDIKTISNKYDKEFKKILTSEQKSKYNMIRKLKHADLKKLEQKNHKESALRPFGVPITQAEYSEQQRQKNSLKNIFKRKD